MNNVLDTGLVTVKKDFVKLVCTRKDGKISTWAQWWHGEAIEDVVRFTRDYKNWRGGTLQEVYVCFYDDSGKKCVLEFKDELLSLNNILHEN